MSNANVFLCGNLWQNLGDQEAGWELVRYLRSSDPQVRTVAEAYLVEAGPRSIKLLQAAVASGALGAAVAAECLAALHRVLAGDNSTDDFANSGLPYDC